MSSTAQPTGRSAGQTVRAWISALRPPTLLAGAAPIALGTALAASEGQHRWGIALVCLGTALSLQIISNLVNDVADFDRGADGPDRLGPARATATGALSRREVVIGAGVAVALSLLGGGYLIAVGGTLFLWLGLAAIAAAIAYTAGPFPLGYHGLGEVAVFAFFGPIAVGGSHALQAGAWSPLALTAGAALGSLASAILTVNNLRDRDGDTRAGKMTLAARFGARFARAEYVGLVALAFVLCAIVAVTQQQWGWLAPLLCTPLAIRETLGVLREDGRALNARLAGTARVEMLFAVLLSVGVML
ncbi:MAG: 1,4-dihydroxy-2-naphthoate polyprenyltransferase [Proteobacteria bacterium]|nr:1,4-dihydroxy-2-naphthoate polyprenyltransferase [Pseudomonadota bacterium]